jgi:hypothetical protein
LLYKEMESSSIASTTLMQALTYHDHNLNIFPESKLWTLRHFRHGKYTCHSRQSLLDLLIAYPFLILDL